MPCVGADGSGFPPWSGLAPSQKPVSKGVGTSSGRGVFPVAGALSRLSVPCLASVEQAGTGKPLSFSPYGAKFPCVLMLFFWLMSVAFQRVF